MTKWWVVLLVACTHREESPRPAYVVHEEHGEVVTYGNAPGAAPVLVPMPTPISKDQHPHTKLKLGHFRNDQYNVGATIDLLSAATENVADIDPAKLRFDGDEKVWLLQGQHGGSGSVDYVRDHDRVMLHITRDGAVTVWIPNPDDIDLPSDAIDLYRDADADPL